MPFDTKAEQFAERAENLSAFSGIKLSYIRGNIERMLSLIGRANIFDQYTPHDISHIDKMLKMLEWLIPDETTRGMTCAEWLMLVLSIYFHDLGMLVMKKEFDNRYNNQEFKKFKERVFDDQFGIEFKNKVSSLGDEKENFLYQEYVRTQHANRVSDWISGSYKLDNSDCDAIVNSINKLLEFLPSKFRRDLAIVCQSHHLNDLHDYNKYKTDARYGEDPDEKVNLHYVAIILRTSDLLHITSDRAPSILYSLINPTDPISIIEWKKQKAVNTIKPKVLKNDDGNLDPNIKTDTIEIIAYFDKPDQAESYFGLISYIMYARDQIKQNYKFIQDSQKTQATTKYSFPWNNIDDTNIETLGFEPKQLSFELDQTNILQLLVGHTLYNDSSVVIRELTQNAIDAIKLQNQIEDINNNRTITKGNIDIHWNSEKGELSVCDNGVGMSLYEIENYLLKVGASKYRSEEFIKKYPSFNAISRFGIGILTCFMISDSIDIFTDSIEEQFTSLLSIRKVDGKYLLKKIAKDNPESHGTKIILKVRSVVDMDKILNAAKKMDFVSIL